MKQGRLLTDYRRTKNRIKEDLGAFIDVMDVDYEMPKILASLMNLIEGRKAREAAPHFVLMIFPKS